MKARIFDIKHFAVHDGPGIRTTIFFKGCPLKCIWCHNPESISKKAQISYLDYKCVDCHRCELICEHGVHVFRDKHVLLRDQCVACGSCQKVCNAGALTLYGRDIGIDEAMDEILEDFDFYGENGGLTLSGGEALMQSDCCTALLKKAKAAEIQTAVDTCGFVKKEELDKVIPYTDLFLYDIKAFDEDVHIRCTGVSNQVVLENLEYLNALGKRIEIRIPYVPNYNDDQIEKIARFLAPMQSISAVKVLPYHHYAKSKYTSLDMQDTLPAHMPSETEIQEAKRILRAHGIKTI